MTAAVVHAVLLVEDNKVNQKVTLSVLAQIGIIADLAEDGLQAITMYKAKPYDLVLMDIQLPRLDGHGATRAIRRLEQTTGRHTPIVALTAQALPGDRELCLTSGMDDYLTKPVNNQVLQRTVTAILAGRSTPTPSTSSPPAAAPPITASATAEVIFDPDIVATIRGFGPAGMRDVYGIMLNDLPQRRGQLALALSQGDAKALAAIAHGVKGACGTVGARALGQAAAQLERLGRAQDLAAIARVWPEVEILFERTITEVKALVAE